MLAASCWSDLVASAAADFCTRSFAVPDLAEDGVPPHSLYLWVQFKQDPRVPLQDSVRNLAWRSQGFLDLRAFQNSAEVCIDAHLVHEKAVVTLERSSFAPSAIQFISLPESTLSWWRL